MPQNIIKYLLRPTYVFFRADSDPRASGPSAARAAPGATCLNLGARLISGPQAPSARVAIEWPEPLHLVLLPARLDLQVHAPPAALALARRAREVSFRSDGQNYLLYLHHSERQRCYCRVQAKRHLVVYVSYCSISTFIYCTDMSTFTWLLSVNCLI